MTATPRRTHGVLVTYRRPEMLEEHLRILADQSRPLASLTVVDNDGDRAVEDLIASETGQRSAQGVVTYVRAAGNPGPAGGFRRGIEAVLAADAHDEDLIVLLDDNDPPRVAEMFEDTVSQFETLRAQHKNVGGVGSWGASLQTRGRLRMETGRSPAVVDYLAGGACPHYTVEALSLIHI